MTATVSWRSPQGIDKQVQIVDWRQKPRGRGGDAWVNFNDRKGSLHLYRSGSSVEPNYHGLTKASYETTVYPDSN